MPGLREVARNIVLQFAPASVSYAINIRKNIRLSYLEPEMPFVEMIMERLGRDRDDVFAVDVGANLGLFTYIFSHAGARVLAIEPQPRLFSYLRKVVDRNVTVVQFALSDRSGSAQLSIPRLPGLPGILGRQDALATIESGNPIKSDPAADVIEVPMATLDSILEPGVAVDFIKIDVEGHELAVLRGATETIEKYHPVFMIEIVKRHNPRAGECGQLLFDAGYAAFCCANGALCRLSVSRFERVLDDTVVEGVDISNFFFFPVGSPLIDLH